MSSCTASRPNMLTKAALTNALWHRLGEMTHRFRAEPLCDLGLCGAAVAVMSVGAFVSAPASAQSVALSMDDEQVWINSFGPNCMGGSQCFFNQLNRSTSFLRTDSCISIWGNTFANNNFVNQFDYTFDARRSSIEVTTRLTGQRTIDTFGRVFDARSYCEPGGPASNLIDSVLFFVNRPTIVRVSQVATVFSSTGDTAFRFSTLIRYHDGNGYIEVGPATTFGSSSVERYAVLTPGPPGRVYEYNCHASSGEVSPSTTLMSSRTSGYELLGKLSVIGPCTTVLNQPSSVLDVCPGSTVQFSYRVEAVPEIVHQWRRNGAPMIDGPTPWGSVIAGANTETMTISNVSPRPPVGPGGDADVYDCIVTSPIGLCTDATSTPASLTVRDGVPATPACSPPPSFTLEPQPATVVAGGAAQFEATAQTTCVGKYAWHWRDAASSTWVPLHAGFNAVGATSDGAGSIVPNSSGGVIVSGEVTDVLHVRTLQLRQGAGNAAAEFRCVVTDDCATSWSAGALLTITPSDAGPNADTPGVCCNPLTGACLPATAGTTPPGYIFFESPATCQTVDCRASGVACCNGSICTILPYGPCLNGGIITSTCEPETCPAKVGVCCSPTTGACASIIGNDSCPPGFVLTLGVASCGVLSPCPMPGSSPPMAWIPVPAAGACCRGATCAVTWSAYACTIAGGRFILAGTCDPAVSGAARCCRADFDQNEQRTIDDVFLFINAWFSADPRCDVSIPQNGIDVDDIFVFVDLWFLGC